MYVFKYFENAGNPLLYVTQQYVWTSRMLSRVNRV